MNSGSEVFHSIKEIPLLCKRLFELEVDFFDMLELVPLILRKTGSMAIRAKLYKGKVKDHHLELPCDVYGIKHVSSSKPVSWYGGTEVQSTALVNYRVDQSGNLGAFNPDATQYELVNPVLVNTYVVNKHVFTQPLGPMIPFVNDQNKCLRFNFKEIDVDVLYVEMLRDDEGFPKVPEKTLEAIAYYMHYLKVRIDFFKKSATKDQEQTAKGDMEQAVAQARTPSFLSQNEIDDMLNVLTSFNKKRHNYQHRR